MFSSLCTPQGCFPPGGVGSKRKWERDTALKPKVASEHIQKMEVGFHLISCPQSRNFRAHIHQRIEIAQNPCAPLAPSSYTSERGYGFRVGKGVCVCFSHCGPNGRVKSLPPSPVFSVCVCRGRCSPPRGFLCLGGCEQQMNK